jgi:cytochrome c-type biogenesis protein CcmF
MLVQIAHFLSILSTGLFFTTFLFSFFFSNKDINITKLISRIYSHGFLLLLTSFLIYVYLALDDNFSVLYIAQHSNSLLPNFYKVTSIWSAHEGSMYLWIVFLCLWGFLYSYFVSYEDVLKAKSLGIISIIAVGFLSFLLLTSNPFETILPVAPIDGADINPVLQDPALAIHPPTLYLGYVGFVIAFANAISFLLNGDKNIIWEDSVRIWSISAWVFLTVGIALGSWWAYYELGWGGYWFWDPVENVALMPWLAATAFIHSLSVSSKSKLLRIWTILLSIMVFSLSLFGAFIVRSGIIDSVHSFANDPERGLYLLSFAGILVILSLAIFSYRLPLLTSNKNIVSFSKESFISINNIIFGTLIFSTMLGILYPLIYEYLYLQKISVGAPFYNAIFVPSTILAALFLFFSIDSKWQRTYKIVNTYSPMILSVILSLLITVVVAMLYKISNLWILVSLYTGFLIIIRYIFVIFNFFFRSKYSNPYSISAHIGLGLLIVSIALNSEFSSERAINIKLKGNDTYLGHEINFDNLELIKMSNHDSVRASFIVNDPKGKRFILSPEKRKYFTRGQITTETAIHATPLKDIYITLGDQLDDGSWIVNIQFNYFIRWVWFSAILMALAGSLLAFSLRRAN